MDHQRIIVTGGAGFIGSAVVRALVARGVGVLNVDKLTYAGNPDSVADVASASNYTFVRADVAEREEMRRAISDFRPDAIIHLAAESHVDRSIDGPGEFIRTNLIGTFTLLQEARAYWAGLEGEARERFRFLHVSTDEVYGSLGEAGLFTEDTPYAPSSPYSASKAGSDHLVRAWHHTYGLPALTTNCSNNYGPYQFPEKLIPLMILNGLEGKPLPVYGRGENVRDWLFVNDHANALLAVLERGQPGATYLVGGRNEWRNIDVVREICRLLDELSPDASIGPRERLITFVADRPGHDLRYAIDPGKTERDIGWRPEQTFETGLRLTVAWYLENRWWWERVRSGEYQGERLGLNVEHVG